MPYSLITDYRLDLGQATITFLIEGITRTSFSYDYATNLVTIAPRQDQLSVSYQNLLGWTQETIRWLGVIDQGLSPVRIPPSAHKVTFERRVSPAQCYLDLTVDGYTVRANWSEDGPVIIQPRPQGRAYSWIDFEQYIDNWWKFLKLVEVTDTLPSVL